MGIKLKSNLDALTYMNGMLDAFTTEINTTVYKDQATSYAYSILAQKFMTSAITFKKTNPKQLQHMFEWNTGGDGGTGNIPLFKVVSQGRGGSKIILPVALRSKVSVPLPKAEDYGGDSNFKPLRRHIFRRKVEVMEAGDPVEIKPINAKKLFVPYAKTKKGHYLSSGTTVRRPGGAQAAGGFTRFWTSWWETTAPVYLKEDIIPGFERGIQNAFNASGKKLRKGTHMRPKRVMINHMTEGYKDAKNNIFKFSPRADDE